jgi:hypothetical protein
VGNNLIQLTNTIDSFRNTFGTDVTVCDVSGTGNEISVKITIRGESINSHTLDTYYKKWKSDLGENYDNGLNYLISEYQDQGIPDPPLDTNDFLDSEVVLIGFLTEDEIIAVASYNKKTNKFTIDRPEFIRSIKEYESGNRYEDEY